MTRPALLTCVGGLSYALAASDPLACVVFAAGIALFALLSRREGAR